LGVDRPREACGVLGVWAPEEPAANLTFHALYALPHRRQESAGMAVADGHNLLVVKDMGLVSQVFDEPTLATLQGHLAIGHTRHSTVLAGQLIPQELLPNP
jgi:amidophosphoribosyltransferase